MMRVNADADTGADAHLDVVGELVGGFQHLDDVFGHAGRILGLGDLLQQHGEFVAAETGQRVDAAQPVGQALCYLLQQFVAGQMAEIVVDVLEAVEIHHQQCDQRVLAP